jgi:hypothetical protein
MATLNRPVRFKTIAHIAYIAYKDNLVTDLMAKT